MWIGLKVGGDVHIGVTPCESRGRHPYHGVRHMIELDELAKNIKPSSVLLLPEEVTQHGDGICIAAGVVCRGKLPAEKWRNSHVRKQIGSIKPSRHGNGQGSASKSLHAVVHQEDFIDGRLPNQILVLRGSHVEQELPVRVLLRQLHMIHPTGILIRIWVE